MDMRRMWEDSMAQVAREQEALEARVGEAEEKKKTAKRILKEVIGSGMLEDRPSTSATATASEIAADMVEEEQEAAAVGQKSPTLTLSRRQTVMDQVAEMSDSGSEDEEFFDAVDAGEVEVDTMLPPSDTKAAAEIIVSGMDISSSFRGYENGIRTRLKINADNRPRISLWVSYLGRSKVARHYAD